MSALFVMTVMTCDSIVLGSGIDDDPRVQGCIVVGSLRYEVAYFLNALIDIVGDDDGDGW